MSIVASGRNAFTLIELLVVIAIIGVLIALLLPGISHGSSDSRTNSAHAVIPVSRGQLQHFTILDAAGKPPAHYFPDGTARWYLLNSISRTVRSNEHGIVLAEDQPPAWENEADLSVTVFLEVGNRLFQAQSGVRIQGRSTIYLDQTIPSIQASGSPPPGSFWQMLMHPWVIGIGTGLVVAVATWVIHRSWISRIDDPVATEPATR